MKDYRKKCKINHLSYQIIQAKVNIWQSNMENQEGC